MSSIKLVDLAGEVIVETEKAYLFFDGLRRTWLPKSQCQWDSYDKIMTMEERLAKDKELV